MLCALCQQNECKEESHIIPAFVFRWLKQHSLTGYLRGSEEPNRRTMDGPKPPLLCPVCEDMFSKWETKFANEVFNPIHRDGLLDLNIDYEDWLPKFCVSLSWRVLKYGMDKNPGQELPHGHTPLIQPTLDVWRDYLLGRRSEFSYHRQHFLILWSPISVPQHLDPTELKFYFERGIDYNTVHSSSDAYVFTKMCRVLIAGTIFTKKPSEWQRTQIHVQGGEYRPGDFQVPGCVFTFFQGALQDIVESRNRISPTQSKKISDAVYKKFGKPIPEN